MHGRCSLRSCSLERGGNRVGGGPARTASTEATALESAGSWKSFLVTHVTPAAMGPESGEEQPVVSPIKRAAAENRAFNPRNVSSLRQGSHLLGSPLHFQYLEQ